MAAIEAFTGFPQEGIQFMRDLAQNNDKAWFEARKQTYLEKVQQPALALVVALGSRLQAEFPEIDYDTRANGGGSLMRIYRDTRFSADKSPYKTNIAMVFGPSGTKRFAGPGFGLQITPQQVELIAGMFAFDKAQLEAYREAVIDDETGKALEVAVAKVKATGDYPIGGKELQRVPRPYDPGHPRAEWLMYKGLNALSPALPLETAYSAELVAVALGHFRNMAPVQQWLMQVLPG